MTQSAASQQPYKQLRRSRDDRMVAGICAGAARYLNIDPVAARVLFVVIAVFSGGTALIAYLIAWALIPEEPVTVVPSYAQETPGPVDQPPAQ